MSHAYYAAKAAAIFQQAGGDPSLAGQIAAWAAANGGRDLHAGIIVDQVGEIIAHTHQVPGAAGEMRAWCVDTDDTDRLDLTANELGMVLGDLSNPRRGLGPVIHLTASQLCTGASAQIPASISHIDHEKLVRDATERVHAAETEQAAAAEHRARVVSDALRAGVAPTAVATAAGVRRARLYAIARQGGYSARVGR